MSSSNSNVPLGVHAGGGQQATSAVTAFEKRQPAAGQLLVKIYTPFYTYYEGDAKSLTALNESGVFDILPGHHNFITMLLPCDVRIATADNSVETVAILRGLLHIKNDKVIVFLDV